MMVEILEIKMSQKIIKFRCYNIFCNLVTILMEIINMSLLIIDLLHLLLTKSFSKSGDKVALSNFDRMCHDVTDTTKKRLC